MKRKIFVGMAAVCLGAGVFCATAGEERPAAISPGFSGETQEYQDAIKKFILAKRSDKPDRGYQSCVETFRDMSKKAGNSPELKLRSGYFLAFALFLQRDFHGAAANAAQVLAAGREILKAEPLAQKAAKLCRSYEDGDVSMEQVQTAMASQKAGSPAALAECMKRFAQTKDAYANISQPEVKKEKLESAIIALAFYADIFKLPVDEMVEKVKQAECVSHLHELVSGWRKYRDAHDGKSVPASIKVADTGKSWEDASTWVNLMQDYIDDPVLKRIDPRHTANIKLTDEGTIISCPSATLKKDGRSIGISSQHPHFGISNMSCGADGTGAVNVKDGTMVFIDGKYYIVSPTWGIKNIEYRHSGGANCAFADGHVEWLPQDVIENYAKNLKASEFWGGGNP